MDGTLREDRASLFHSLHPEPTTTYGGGHTLGFSLSVVRGMASPTCASLGNLAHLGPGGQAVPYFMRGSPPSGTLGQAATPTSVLFPKFKWIRLFYGNFQYVGIRIV
jgi:hypothetical protein